MNQILNIECPESARIPMLKILQAAALAKESPLKGFEVTPATVTNPHDRNKPFDICIFKIELDPEYILHACMASLKDFPRHLQATQDGGELRKALQENGE